MISDKRAHGEHRQAGREQQTAPEQVGQRAGGQEESGERQRVGVDRPLKIGKRRVERLLNVRQRDVHDRQVEQEHEDAGADSG
jgi:hypothetical protein